MLVLLALILRYLSFSLEVVHHCDPGCEATKDKLVIIKLFRFQICLFLMIAMEDHKSYISSTVFALCWQSATAMLGRLPLPAKTDQFCRITSTALLAEGLL